MQHPAMEPVPGMLGVTLKVTLEIMRDIQVDNYYLSCYILPEDLPDCHIPDHLAIFPQFQPTLITADPQRLPQKGKKTGWSSSLFHPLWRMCSRLYHVAAL